MRRLLVGDVGSGKTAVAFAAAAMIARAGGTTLMMVPTETLAEQQARVLAPWGKRLGFGVATLTGSAGAAARAAIRDGAAAGTCRMVIGTQALLGMGAELPRLGLVIVDEQHRFGVAERARLGRPNGQESGRAPHLLAMSATPIPRSLALATHGDLDASFLTERPAGRGAAAATACLEASARAAAYDRLRDEVAAGRQAFVVCAAREEAKRNVSVRTIVSAVGHQARLARALAPARVGLLHGALAPEAKDQALRAFAGGALDVLVATTVVELGIDVPNATVMIVEGADRFGLAQLHQLRGRVGRGAAPGVCFLCPTEGELSAEAKARLELLETTSDGFRLAEADLEQRGFGDLMGTRQAGAGGTTLAEVAELLGVARREAEVLLAGDPTLGRSEHRALGLAVEARARSVFGEEAG
jgi:ATP-dependent DNA helicase RecG